MMGVLAGADAEVKGWLDTTYPPLNQALSGNPAWGLPYGRIVEIYGPSSSGKSWLATQLMISAQKAGGVALLNDHEFAFNLQYAARQGLNLEAPFFGYGRPETLEGSVTDALKITEMVRASGEVAKDAPIICVFDSIAAMVPRSVFEKGYDELTMADSLARAKALSTVLPSVNQRVAKLNACFVFLNQIRMKPGVCLRYDTPVTLADGTQVKIGKLVHDRKPVEVLTVNPDTRQVTVRKIEQFHRNAHDGRWVQVVTTGGKNGKRSAFLTPEHQVLTPSGWVRADEIKLGDRVNTVDMRYYTEDQHRVILGSLLGDGQIRFGDGKNALSEKGRLRLVHGHKQHDYLQWKGRLLGIGAPKKTALHSYSDTKSSIEFSRYLSIKKFKAVLSIPDEWIEKIDPLVAAIWFMDDGNYSATQGGLKYGEGRYSIAASVLSGSVLEKIATALEKQGLGRAICKVGKGLFWSGADAALFGAAVAKFVPECMSYKLNRKLKAEGDQLALAQMLPANEVYSNAVIKVAQSQGTKALDRYKYDLGIPDTHTFVAGGGIVVHNCYGDPTTTPGGAAMEFYASQRLSLGRKLIKEEVGGEKEVTAQQIGITTVKNRFARPRQEVDVLLRFNDEVGTEFDRVTSLIQVLIEQGKIAYSKPRATWDGKQYFVKALVEKIKAENLYPQLVELYLKA